MFVDSHCHLTFPELASRLAEIRQARGAAEQESAGAESALAALEAELRRDRATAHERRQVSLDLFSAESERRGARDAFRARLQSLAERGEALGARLDELTRRRESQARGLEEANERMIGLTREHEAASRACEEVEERLAGLLGGTRRAEEALSRLRQEEAATDSRLQTLLELKRNYEGVSEGAKALLADETRVPGLLGMVADVLEVPARYLNALEASLGEASAFVLAENRDAIEFGLERLRSLESGRATLVDLSAVSPGAPPAFADETGVLGRASELVRCEAHYRPLVDRLLGSVIVVEDRATAGSLAGRSEGGLRFVSLEGEVWERGRVRAGSTRSLGGLLHREMEIRELSGRLAELRLEIEGQRGEVESISARRAAEEASRLEAQAQREARRQAVEALEREIEGGEREIQWADSESETQAREKGTLEAERQTLERSLQSAEAELADFQSRLESARVSAADSDGLMRELETRRDESAAAAQARLHAPFRLILASSPCRRSNAPGSPTRRLRPPVWR